MSSESVGSSLRSLTCNCCGAPLHLTDARFTACPYCGQAFNLSELRGARQGELLLGADFRDPDVPGWKVYHKENLRIGEGGLPQLVGTFQKQEGPTWILETRGSFDNIDVTATLSFVKVEDITKHCRLGFDVRWTEEGHYNADISPKGNYCVASYVKADAENRWHMFVDCELHPALRSGVRVANRLRVVAYNDHLRVYINNVLASSVRDSRYTYGTIGLVLENSGADVVFVVSDLEVREAIEAI
jgi:hypothetical protein